MKSIRIEALRVGPVDRVGVLQKKGNYIITFGERTATGIETQLSFEEFRKLMKVLQDPASTLEERRRAMEAFSDVVTPILSQNSFDWRKANEGDGMQPLQADLVVNPGELSALPFELGKATSGEWLFQADPPVVITRRIRGSRDDVPGRNWPAEPKILFAWASPSGLNPVPHATHIDALLAALLPWIEPLPGHTVSDYRSRLTILEKATLEDIRNACAGNGSQAGHFTHVHLLAHGCEVGAEDDPVERRFGLALHGAEDGVAEATPEQIADALEPTLGTCSIVTLASCFGGSQANSLIPRGGLAYTLHERGFPIVVGSQWPLSYPGSAILARTFYESVLRGVDARLALHQARLALFESRESRDDWASLVGYVTLPERYLDYLAESRLERLFAALDTSSKWADQLAIGADGNEDIFRRVDDQINARTEELLDALARNQASKRSDVIQENHGLVGSSWKRRAELLHVWNGRAGSDAKRHRKIREYLEKAKAAYACGFKCNLSDHWLATQVLSLSLVLDGKLSDVRDWYIASLAATNAWEHDEKDYWSLGSLWEIHLLARRAEGGDQLEQAKDALRKHLQLAEEAGPEKKKRAQTATLRQLERYRSWWTNGNGFLPGGSDVSREAAELIALIEDPFKASAPSRTHS